MVVPEGYAFKASSDSFNHQTTVTIYYNGVKDDYLLVIETPEDEQGWFVNKQVLELIVHAGTDVLDDVR